MRFPSEPEALTVEWLNQVLSRQGTFKQAQVTAMDVEVLGGTKGALGQIARLKLVYDDHQGEGQGEAPRSIIAKFLPANPATRVTVIRRGWFEREIRFYRELAG